MNKDKIIDTIKFNSDGLVPAIAQDAGDGQVLMVAWMNRESLGLTMDTKIMHYWSRSRQKLWKKGETSGHIQTVKSMAVDCDRDVLLFRIEQDTAACHVGYRSCFYTEVDLDTLDEKIVGEKMF